MDKRFLDDYIDDDQINDQQSLDGLDTEMYGFEIEPPYLFDPEILEIDDAIEEIQQEIPADHYFPDEEILEIQEAIDNQQKIPPPIDVELWII